MANRLKPLSHAAWQAQQARIILAAARRFDWRRMPLRQQVEHLFDVFGTIAVAEAHFGAGSPLIPFFQHFALDKTWQQRDRGADLLRALADKRSTLLWRPELAPALAAVAEFWPHRCRELADWQPRSRNPFRQLESLVRHLFDQYGDVPAWILNSWTSGRLHEGGLNIADLTWHLGRGGALRTFHRLPVKLSRKVEHHLRQAPAGYTFLQALRYAQLAARGLSEWLGPVLDSRLGRCLGRDDAFWLQVVEFFAASPMVDPYQLGPVCDWIHQKRYVGIGDEPPQPNFSLRGRSMAGLLAHTARWHRQLAQQAHQPAAAEPAPSTSWEPMAVQDFAGGTKAKVRITQLLSYGELVAEGRALRHCVASYLEACRRGRSGIFSFTLDGSRLLTLEVQANRTIVQARGLLNRRLNEEELGWLQHWAAANRLLIPKHLY